MNARNGKNVITKTVLVLPILLFLIFTSCIKNSSLGGAEQPQPRLLFEHVAGSHDLYEYDFGKKQLKPFMVIMDGKKTEVRKLDSFTHLGDDKVIRFLTSKEMQIDNDKRELYVYVTVRDTGRQDKLWEMTMYTFDLDSRKLKDKKVVYLKGYDFFLYDNILYYSFVFEKEKYSLIKRMDLIICVEEELLRIEGGIGGLIRYKDYLFCNLYTWTHVYKERGQHYDEYSYAITCYNFQTGERKVLGTTEFCYSGLAKTLIYPDAAYTGVNIYNLADDIVHFIPLDDIEEFDRFTMIDQENLVYRVFVKAADSMLSSLPVEGYLKMVNINTMQEKRIMKTRYYSYIGEYIDAFTD